MNKLSLFKTLLVIIFCSFSFSSLFAQDEEQKKADTELYKTASDLLNKANKAFKNEDMIEAEKLFTQALKTYPIPSRFDYFIIKKIELGDVRGANKFWDNIIASLISKPKILYQTTTNIGGLIKYKYRPSSDYIKNIRLTKSGSNFYKGDIKLGIYS